MAVRAKGRYQTVYFTPEYDMLEYENQGMIRILYEQYPEIVTVFIFSREKSASWALDYKPFWFIRRESLRDELCHVIAMTFEALERRMKRQIVVTRNGIRTLLENKDILFVAIKQRKVFCYLEKKGVVEIRGTLKKFLERLDDRKLVQINSGCAVNVEWIESYTKDMVVIKVGKKLPVSRGMSKEVRLKINRHWGEE